MRPFLRLFLFAPLVLSLSSCNVPLIQKSPTAVSVATAAVLADTPTAVPALPTSTRTLVPTAVPTDTPVPPPTVAPTAAAPQFHPLDVQDQTIQQETKTPPETIDLQYPLFSDPAGASVDGLNKQITDLLNRYQADFHELVRTNTPPPVDLGNNGLYIRYEMHQNAEGFVSVFFNISTYYQGMAHPLPQSETVNYDLRRDQPLLLADLFNPGVDYLSILSKICIEDLKSQGVLEWDAGAGPDAANFKSWNITPDGLLINFDPYQVAAYAAGFQKVLIPWDILAGDLNPDLGLK